MSAERRNGSIFSERGFAPSEKNIEYIPFQRVFGESKGSILAQRAQEVSIFASAEGQTRHFDIVPHMVVKRTNVLSLLKRFSSLPIKPGQIAESWGGNSTSADIVQDPIIGLIELFQQQNPVTRDLGGRLAEIIETEDDSPFVDYVATNIKAHSDAWQTLLRHDNFITRLKTETLPHPILEDSERLRTLLDRFPAVKKGQRRRSSGSAEDTSFENFSQKGQADRAQFINSQLGSLFETTESYFTFQKNAIRQLFGIHAEFQPADSEPIYFLGQDKEIDVHNSDESAVVVTKGDFAAKVEVEQDGLARIKPESPNFLIPVISFDSDGDIRQLYLQENLSPNFKSLHISRKNSPVVVDYSFERSQLNPLVGLMLLYDFLSTNKADRVRPELLPFAAILEARKMTGRRIFDKVEQISDSY